MSKENVLLILENVHFKCLNLARHGTIIIAIKVLLLNFIKSTCHNKNNNVILLNSIGWIDKK